MSLNIERLELLAAALEQQKFAAPAEFDLSYWIRNNGDHLALRNRENATVVADKEFGSAECVVVDPARVDCSAAACACGHAALMPEFHALGFKLVVPVSGVFAGSAQPFFDGHLGWDAVRLFFGLQSEWADYLFDIDSYVDEDDDEPPTAADVALRIRNLAHDERLSHQMGLSGAQ
jgi:hypothetical protein